MRFQEYRVDPEEAEKTYVELPDRAALVAHCKKQLRCCWPSKDLQDSDFRVSPYGQQWTDPRLGKARKWVTHIVVIEGYGVMGFTDSEC